MKTNRIRKAIINGLSPLEAGELEPHAARSVKQMNDALLEIPRDRTAVFLTDAELRAVGHLIRNGWGDGDFADNLGQSAPCAVRAAEKLGVGLSCG